jgi:hypothetical protein
MSNETKRPMPLKPVPPAKQGATAEKPEPVYVPATQRKAFSVERVPNGWAFVTVTYTDEGVIESVEKSEPDVKSIIIERFKIAALKWWTTIG